MASISNQVPDKDPADTTTLAGAFRSIFKKLQQGMDGMLPAIVVAYDRPSNTATVRPCIQLLSTEGQTLPRANLAKISVLALGNGKFVINFPLQPGDFGWIEASDRDISLYTQSASEAQPNTTRMHSFSDGRFIPDAMRNWTMPDGVGDTEMFIATTDGQTLISLDSSTHDIRIDTVGAVRIQKASMFHVENTVAQAVFDCPVQFNEPVSLASTLTTAAGVDLTAHEHDVSGSVTAGPRNP